MSRVTEVSNRHMLRARDAIDRAEQPELQLLLEKPGPPSMDERTAELVRELVTKGAMGMAGIIEVDDVHATYENLKTQGVEFTEEPTERFYGIDCGLRDPFGNPLRIGTTKEVPEVSTRPSLPPRTPEGVAIASGLGNHDLML